CLQRLRGRNTHADLGRLQLGDELPDRKLGLAANPDKGKSGFDTDQAGGIPLRQLFERHDRGCGTRTDSAEGLADLEAHMPGLVAQLPNEGRDDLCKRVTNLPQRLCGVLADEHILVAQHAAEGTRRPLRAGPKIPEGPGSEPTWITMRVGKGCSEGPENLGGRPAYLPKRESGLLAHTFTTHAH